MGTTDPSEFTKTVTKDGWPIRRVTHEGKKLWVKCEGCGTSKRLPVDGYVRTFECKCGKEFALWIHLEDVQTEQIDAAEPEEKPPAYSYHQQLAEQKRRRGRKHWRG